MAEYSHFAIGTPIAYTYSVKLSWELHAAELRATDLVSALKAATPNDGVAHRQRYRFPAKGEPFLWEASDWPLHYQERQPLLQARTRLVLRISSLVSLNAVK
jgi:hypothetical protein